MPVEFNVKPDRSGTPGFYIHVSADNRSLLTAIEVYAKQNDTALLEQIEGYTNAYDITTTLVAAEEAPEEEPVVVNVGEVDPETAEALKAL